MLAGSSILAAQKPTPPDSAARPKTAPAKLPVSPLDSLLPRDTTGQARDTTPVDSATARRRRIAADTIKSPLAHAESPVLSDARWRWAGEDLRSSGAVTLADLLERIPGATGVRANWIPAPQFVAYNGDVGRVRVFLDGVELDAIDPRNKGVLDLVTMPLWQLEEVSVERAAGELRVYLRSWRVERTTPETRTDITSGSEGTNLYRGYFGKRMRSGGVLQLAAQQYSSLSPRIGGDGTSLQVFGRVGWARKKWSVDATFNRASVDRAVTARFVQYGPLLNSKAIPAFQGVLSGGYGRIAWGDPDAKAAPWVQLIAATQGATVTHKSSSSTLIGSPATSADSSADTTASRAQYVLSAGASGWGVHGSATARMRAGNGRRDFSPSARLAYDRGFLSLTAFGETRGADSTRRLDVGLRLTPWRWIELAGAFGSYAPKSDSVMGPAFTASRAEAAMTFWGRRVSAGMITRGLTRLAAPSVFDSTLVRVTTGAEKGMIGSIRGPIYRDLGIDITAVRWAAAGPYRPQMEIQSRLILDSSFPGKFTRNNFHMLAELFHEHRTPLFFPTTSGGVGKSTVPIDILSARLEIRIESGTVFWEGRNLFGKVYDTAPGYMMPRAQQYYGLRWSFWN